MKTIAFLLCLLIPTIGFAAGEKTTCQEQKTGGHTAKLCLHAPGMFKHDLFTLSVDDQQIFTLVDDYAEAFSLTHKVPEGVSIELPLSQQGMREVTLSGGCKPITNPAGDTEIGRLCNITWGKIDIIKNMKFIEE